MTALARIDLRLNPTDKARISRAADLRGVPVSVFVRDAVLREAENVMANAKPVTLSPAETKRLLAALGEPFRPSARLQRAMDEGRSVALGHSSLAARLHGRATARMSTDEIMRLTRGA